MISFDNCKDQVEVANQEIQQLKDQLEGYKATVKQVNKTNSSLLDQREELQKLVEAAKPLQTSMQTDINVEMELNAIDASFKELRSDIASLRAALEVNKENIRDLFDCFENSQREFDLEHNKRVDGFAECLSRDLDLAESDAKTNTRVDDLLGQVELLLIAFNRHRNGFDKETE